MHVPDPASDKLPLKQVWRAEHMHTRLRVEDGKCPICELVDAPPGVEVPAPPDEREPSTVPTVKP